jgi:peptide/nickel transport system permease protein
MGISQSLFIVRFLHNRKTLIGAILVTFFILIAVFAPLLAPQHPYEMNAAELFHPPSRHHIFGTDELGRDVFSRALYGARISIVTAFLVGSMSGLIGIIIGLPAAYLGGKFDLLVMRAIDVTMSFPWILLALLIASIIGASLNTVIIALTIIYAPGSIRVVRSKALSIKEETYVAVATAVGESDLSIMLRYVLPNCVGPILVQTTLNMSWSILGEAGISYLGFGSQPPTPSWGLMLADATDFLYSAPPTLVILPGLLLLILVLGLNFLGDGLRDLLDPKFRRL